MKPTSAAEPNRASDDLRILVAGEALIDFVQTPFGGEIAFVPFPGGSPLNVAVGLARLGAPAGFLGRLSSDLFGQMLHDHLLKNGVDVRYVSRGQGPATLAFVVEDPGHDPRYVFYANGAEDRLLDAAAIPQSFPPALQAIHFGSYALAIEPIGTSLTTLMERERGRRLLSLDPNVRPSIIGDPDVYREKLLHWIGLCDVIKISRADARIVWPDADPVGLARQWLEQGPRLVIVTDGSRPVVGVCRRETVEVAAPAVNVVDTVGAGDAFTSGFLAWLHEKELLDRNTLGSLTTDMLTDGIRFAAQVATLTCTRRGASPPTRSELAP